MQRAVVGAAATVTVAVTVAGGGTTVGGAGAAVVPGLVGAAVGVGPTTSSSPVDRVSGAATLKASVEPPLAG